MSKVIRIESGAVGLSTTDLRALLNLYNITDQARTEELTELARASRQTSWWSRYRADISPQYLQYIEYEEAASVIRLYEPLVIPGLFQTEECATAIIRELADPPLSEEMIRKRVEIRVARQEILEQDEPPTVIGLIGEAAIQYVIGQSEIARGQLDRLIEMASRPNITIEVIPFSAGIHRGMLESFHILEIPDLEDSDVLFLETSRDAIFSRDEAGDITGYRETFELLDRMSAGADGTRNYLRDLSAKIS